MRVCGICAFSNHFYSSLLFLTLTQSRQAWTNTIFKKYTTEATLSELLGCEVASPHAPSFAPFTSDKQKKMPETSPKISQSTEKSVTGGNESLKSPQASPENSPNASTTLSTPPTALFKVISDNVTLIIGPHIFRETKFYSVWLGEGKAAASMPSNRNGANLANALAVSGYRRRNAAGVNAATAANADSLKISEDAILLMVFEFKENPGVFWIFPTDAIVEKLNFAPPYELISSFNLPSTVFDELKQRKFTKSKVSGLLTMQLLNVPKELFDILLFYTHDPLHTFGEFVTKISSLSSSYSILFGAEMASLSSGLVHRQPVTLSDGIFRKSRSKSNIQQSSFASEASNSAANLPRKMSSSEIAMFKSDSIDSVPDASLVPPSSKSSTSSKKSKSSSRSSKSTKQQNTKVSQQTQAIESVSHGTLISTKDDASNAKAAAEAFERNSEETTLALKSSSAEFAVEPHFSVAPVDVDPHGGPINMAQVMEQQLPAPNSTPSVQSTPSFVERSGTSTATKTSPSPTSGRKCFYCGVRTTPMWRRGPEGAGTLCNACGVKWKNGKILPAVNYADAITKLGKKRTPSSSSKKSSSSGNSSTKKASHDDLHSSSNSSTDLDDDAEAELSTKDSSASHPKTRSRAYSRDYDEVSPDEGSFSDSFAAAASSASKTFNDSASPDSKASSRVRNLRSIISKRRSSSISEVLKPGQSALDASSHFAATHKDSSSISQLQMPENTSPIASSVSAPQTAVAGLLSPSPGPAAENENIVAAPPLKKRRM